MKNLKQHLNQHPLLKPILQYPLFSSKLVQGAGSVFALRIVSVGLSFISRLILSRALGSAGIGIINYCLAWISVFLIFTTMGFDRVIIREVSAAQSDNRYDIAAGVLRIGIIVPFMLALLVMIGAIVLALPSVGILSIASQTGMAGIVDTWVLLIIFMLAIPFRTLTMIFQSAMRTLGFVGKSETPENFIQPLLYIIMVGIGWYFWHSNLPLLYVVSGYLVVVIVTSLYSFYMLYNITPDTIRNTKPTYHLRQWMLDAVPLLFVSGMSVINSRADIIMIGLFNGVESVGVYSTAAQLGWYVVFPLVAANTALAPRFASLYRQNKMTALQSLVTRSSRMVLIATLVIALVYIVWGKWLLGIFGTEFEAGYTALIIIALGQVLNTTTGSVGVLLMMTNHSWAAGLGVAASAIVNIILNLFFIPAYGIEGAAVATLVSIVIWNGILVVFTWSKLKIMPTVIGKFWK